MWFHNFCDAQFISQDKVLNNYYMVLNFFNVLNFIQPNYLYNLLLIHNGRHKFSMKYNLGRDLVLSRTKSVYLQLSYNVLYSYISFNSSIIKLKSIRKISETFLTNMNLLADLTCRTHLYLTHTTNMTYQTLLTHLIHLKLPGIYDLSSNIPHGLFHKSALPEL